MPRDRFDAVVVGLGAMGSAALAELARRGLRVLGLDRLRPPHTLGSSHGESRIIRKAYMEHPDYVPLVLRAYDAWMDLERRSGLELLIRTGGLMIGRRGSRTVEGALLSARTHGLEAVPLDADELARRFPPFRPGPDEVAVYEPDAGVLRPEVAVTAFLLDATLHGAQVLTGPEYGVVSLESGAAGWTIQTHETRFEAGKVVVSTGAWLSGFAGDLGFGALRTLSVERQVPFWMHPQEIAPFLIDRFPIYVWELSDGRSIYGFPTLDQRTVKGALHHGGDRSPDAEMVDRTVREVDRAAYRDALAGCLPALAGPPEREAVCLYTNTPDEHFLLGAVPGRDGIFVAGGFSGHGFKFAPVVGEALADLVIGGVTGLPIGFLSPDRFRTTSPKPLSDLSGDRASP